MPTFTLTLDGFASIPHLAERANVRLSATTSGDVKQEVAASVLRAAERIEGEVHDIQGRTDEPSAELPIAHWSKTSLTSTSRTYNPNSFGTSASNVEEKRIFTANIDFDIRFKDFAALGKFSAALSGVDHCEIQSIEWRLLPSTRESFESRLRKEAAADALKKAIDYCSVLCPDEHNVRIVPTKLTAQPTSFGYPHGRSNVQMQSQQLGPYPSTPGLVFSPQECKMETSVEVEFTIETNGVAMHDQQSVDINM